MFSNFSALFHTQGKCRVTNENIISFLREVSLYEISAKEMPPDKHFHCPFLEQL